MRVFSNSAISLDGKLGPVSYDHVRLGTDEDLRRMSWLRSQADAVLVGGRTWRAWSLPLIEDAAVVDRPRARPVINAVLTRTGQGARSGRFFEHPGTRPVFFGGADTSLEGLPAGTPIHRAEGEPTLAWVLGLLERHYGVENLLVEGGGALIAQLLAVDLLDELNVTLCPLLLGGRGGPSLVDGPGFDPRSMRRLELCAQERVGNEIYLRYRVLRERETGYSRG
jgi:5-amino-6-(5-phosphoribosylamino)uracil reductase